MTVLAAASSSASVWAQPGTLGFLVVFGMGVILFFVFRSMSRHLKKVNAAAAAEAKLWAGPDGSAVKADGAQAGPAADAVAGSPTVGNGSRPGTAGP